MHLEIDLHILLRMSIGKGIDSMILRQLKEKDADGMLEWMHDSDIQKCFRVDMSSRKRRDVIAFINTSTVQVVDGGSIHYAITDEDDEYLGTISLKDIDLSARNAEFAISLRKMAQGKGVAVSATKELLNIAFNTYNFERVYLNVLAENQRAIHLYEKCGFVYEGEFRKHLFLNGEFKSLKWYSMLREEYLIKFDEESKEL